MKEDAICSKCGKKINRNWMVEFLATILYFIVMVFLAWMLVTVFLWVGATLFHPQDKVTLFGILNDQWLLLKELKIR